VCALLLCSFPLVCAMLFELVKLFCFVATDPLAVAAGGACAVRGEHMTNTLQLVLPVWIALQLCGEPLGNGRPAGGARDILMGEQCTSWGDPNGGTSERAVRVTRVSEQANVF
jgi:hypothetical protein